MTGATLDEYGQQIIALLKRCRDAVGARDLLREVNFFLLGSGINLMTQERFWARLDGDLEILGEDAKFIHDRVEAIRLGTVIAAARAHIGRYPLSGESE